MKRNMPNHYYMSHIAYIYNMVVVKWDIYDSSSSIYVTVLGDCVHTLTSSVHSRGIRQSFDLT